MYIAKVIGKCTATIKHKAYEGKKMLVAQRIDSVNNVGDRTAVVVLDYLGAGEGDIVLIGEGPSSIGIEKGPIREFIVGIIDHVDLA
jgi:microcompartment protein CcmK/EutM